MNLNKRKQLLEIATKLGVLYDKVEEMLDEEQKVYDKMSEKDRFGEKGANISETLGSLEFVAMSMNEADTYLNSVIGNRKELEGSK
jgi:hypothetical protein